MKKEIFICDKCGAEIKDVAYSLTCYAEDVPPDPTGMVSCEIATQNIRQNFSGSIRRHLCRACKDKITDGVFIV